MTKICLLLLILISANTMQAEARTASPATKTEQGVSGGSNSEITPFNQFKSLAAIADKDISTCKGKGRFMLFAENLTGKPVKKDDVDSLETCIKQAQAHAQANYVPLRAMLKNNSEAMAAVNDYMASLMALFDSLWPPHSNENDEYSYSSRIEAAVTDLKKKEYLVSLQLM